VFAAGDTGITAETVDTIVDFTTAEDTFNVLDAAVARGVTVTSGAGNTNLADFIVAADAALTVGVGVYAIYNFGGFPLGAVVVDENQSGKVDEGDTIILLSNLNNGAASLVVTDFV
jgi:dihydrodipicolinate reductase